MRRTVRRSPVRSGATAGPTDTRKPERTGHLARSGVDHPIVDTGRVAEAVREIFPDGADAALELIGTPTLADTLRSLRVQGTVCFTGMVSNEWTIKDFYPIDYVPSGVRLTAYSGDASDLPPGVFQRVLDAVAAGQLAPPIHRVYHGLEEVLQAHADMEANAATGKLVVRVRPNGRDAQTPCQPR